MTETEWLNCSKLEPMLLHVRQIAGERKLRLFALACCQRIRHFITDPRSEDALRFCEQHVETSPNRKKGRSAIKKAARQAHGEAYRCGIA